MAARARLGASWLAFGLAVALACASSGAPPARPAPERPEPRERCDVRELRVQVTAYNSLPEQTDDTPNVGAFGDRLGPGTRAVAVSRDLETQGLVRGSVVCLEDDPVAWTVLDRTHQRLRRRVDLFMGRDVEAALAWGIQDATIRWLPPGQPSHCTCDA